MRQKNFNFITGLCFNGPRIGDKLELSGQALEIQKDTGPLFNRAAETDQEDQAILGKLNLLLFGKPSKNNASKLRQ